MITQKGSDKPPDAVPSVPAAALLSRNGNCRELLCPAGVRVPQGPLDTVDGGSGPGVPTDGIEALHASAVMSGGSIP